MTHVMDLWLEFASSVGALVMVVAAVSSIILAVEDNKNWLLRSAIVFALGCAIMMGALTTRAVYADRNEECAAQKVYELKPAEKKP